jgi:hypothetical protein
MRNRTFATLGILALFAAASAFGQQKLRVDIPFEFHFADIVMPAGQYEVDTQARNVLNLLSFDCYDCRVHAIAVPYAIGGGDNAPTEGRLVFDKLGDTYFFAEVWVPGHTQGMALSKSKTERELARVIRPARSSQVILAGSFR